MYRATGLAGRPLCTGCPAQVPVPPTLMLLSLLHECKIALEILLAFHVVSSNPELLCRADTAAGRLAEAQAMGQAAQVCVQSKHFQRGIHSSLVADLARVLCGIDKNLGFLQLLVVHEHADEPDSYAIDKHITIKLPVRDV